MVLLAVGAAAYGAVKLTRKDADRIEQHTGTSVEELSDEDLVAAMEELGIQSIELDENDRAIITRETDQSLASPESAAASVEPEALPAQEVSYLDELERLAGLRDQGVITEEEFAAKKGQLLGL
jgi:hypothetical protein